MWSSPRAWMLLPASECTGRESAVRCAGGRRGEWHRMAVGQSRTTGVSICRSIGTELVMSVPSISTAADPPHRLSGSGEATYWDIDDIQFHCRISRTTAWRLARHDTDFPSPVVLGPRNIVWPRREVLAYFEACRQPSHYGGRSPSTSSASPEYRETFAYKSRQLPVRSVGGK